MPKFVRTLAICLDRLNLRSPTVTTEPALVPASGM